jgi:hypothetical protein
MAINLDEAYTSDTPLAYMTGMLSRELLRQNEYVIGDVAGYLVKLVAVDQTSGSWRWSESGQATRPNSPPIKSAWPD